VNASSILPAALPEAQPAFSPEHLQQLAGARVQGKKVRRAIFVANFDGWSIGAFGALTLLFGMTDPTSVAMGLGMMAVAWIELRGAKAMQRLDSQAARTLGLNQLALAAIFILYSLWRIYSVSTGPGPYESIKAADAQMAHMLKPIEDLTRVVSLALYGVLILIAIFAQGGLALYYFSRVKQIESYVARTPEWIIKLQRAGVAV
jgi:hypothetical protein